MSLISEFLGTEDWVLNNSPMYRELKEELTAMNLLDKKRVQLSDEAKHMLKEVGVSVSEEKPTFKDELIDIMLESYEQWEETYKNGLKNLQNEFRKAAERGCSEYRISTLLANNRWIKPEFVKAYFESMEIMVDISDSDRIIFSWLN